MIKHFLLLILFSLAIQAYSQKITFEYDSAGNQTKRELTLVTNKKAEAVTKETLAVTEEELQKIFLGDVLSYYPNPVREELYLKWELADDNYVKGVQVYNFNGQILKSYSRSANDDSQTIPFQAYPAGVYLIVLEYNSSDQKTIKIIKK